MARLLAKLAHSRAAVGGGVCDGEVLGDGRQGRDAGVERVELAPEDVERLDGGGLGLAEQGEAGLVERELNVAGRPFVGRVLDGLDANEVCESGGAHLARGGDRAQNRLLLARQDEAELADGAAEVTVEDDVGQR